jgi:hypothetical protein
MHLPLVFTSSHALLAALGLVGATIAIAIFRHIALRRMPRLIFALGAILLAVSAGGPRWERRPIGSVVVMVDLSPSTRGATFRDRSALDQRIRQLLGPLLYQAIGFSDHNQGLRIQPPNNQTTGNHPLATDPPLRDIPADHTVFAPPPADAVVLFSDGQFDLPASAPPTYPVIDPAMDHPEDAAVSQLSVLDHQVAASITNSGADRSIHWTGAAPESLYAPPGDSMQFAAPAGRGEITAALSPGDRWPENDSLTLALPPPDNAEHWWVGTGCPAGWTLIPTLPDDPADYLRPGIIVLNNLPATALSSSQYQRLQQYVRDLGGSLLIVGGDRAFAAGGYDGTALDDLSPLASSPPQPTLQWQILIDGSGSMEGDPWKTELAAVTDLLPQLPTHDLLSVGSFAATLHWWVHDVPAGTPLPPLNIYPTGPTKLATALEQITTASDGTAPTQLLLMTDADADLPYPEQLAAAMISKKIRLFLLALGNGSALPALRSIADKTGGSVVQQLDARQWVSSANLLLRSALPTRYQHRPVQVGSTASPAPAMTVSEWNQTWLKTAATELQKSSEAAMAARWNAGLGKVIAIAYPASAGAVAHFADSIAWQPADPRFTVRWDETPPAIDDTSPRGLALRITVIAVDGNNFLNDQNLTVELRDPMTTGAAPKLMQVPQTAPGRYELTLAPPRSPVFVTVTEANRTLRRFAVAGRYPPEFDAIGNNRPNLKALADRTGGSVIPPGPAQPIAFHWPLKQVDVSSHFALAGFATLAIGLILNRRQRR